MGLLDISKLIGNVGPQLDHKEILYNEYSKRHDSLVTGWRNWGIATLGLSLLGGYFYYQSATGGSSGQIGMFPMLLWGGWSLIRGIKTTNYFDWKKKNKEQLADAIRYVEKKKKQTAQLNKVKEHLEAISKELPPEKIYNLLEREAAEAIELVKTADSSAEKLIGVIKHNLSEAKKICDYLVRLELFLEDEDLVVLGQERALYLGKLDNTLDPALRQQIESSISIIEQRYRESEELSKERLRLRAQLASFQQAIENVQVQAERYKGKAMTKGAAELSEGQTFDGANELLHELEMMGKIQAELDAATTGGEKFQHDMDEIRRKRAQQLGRQTL